jgi:type I restriction enzyme M protein
MAKEIIESGIEEAEDTVAVENSLICLLTGESKKAIEREQNLQSLIRMLNEEYGFDLTDMERDFTVAGENEEGKKWKRKIELIVFKEKTKHTEENIIRLCVVLDSKSKETDKKKGVVATLENALGAIESCEFGIWTN